MSTESQYSLGSDVGASGSALDQWVKGTVGLHYMLSAAVILVLLLVVIYLLMKKEGFSPSSNGDIRKQVVSLSGAEALDNGPAPQAAQPAAPGQFVLDPNAKPGTPGSLGWQILHSADFDCDKRKAVGDDAWGWMTGVANTAMPGDNVAFAAGASREGLTTKKVSDNELSFVMTGGH